MFRRWFRQYLPSSASVQKLPMLRHFSRYLSHPSLWALNRRGVAGGVAVGLFCGLIPGPFQIGGALIGALLFKVNLPVSIVVTFYTNPFTIIPLYMLAVAYGEWILGQTFTQGIPKFPAWDWGQVGNSLEQAWVWLYGLGPALALGLPALMCTLSVLGYVSVRVLWSMVVRFSVWHKRSRLQKKELMQEKARKR